MIIRTKQYVSGRTLDGRVYSAGEGAVTVVDEADAGMVELFERLAKLDLVEIERDAPVAEVPVAEDPPPAKTPRSTSRTRAVPAE